MKYFKDYFITDGFFIKGHVSTGGGRLSTFLNTGKKEFVEVEEASCTQWDGRSIRMNRMAVRVSEILLAYEAAEAGDEALRALAGRGGEQKDVTICLSSRAHIEIKGRLRPNLCGKADFGPHAFIVVTQPRLTQSNSAENLLSLFPEKLSYLIVNRDRILLAHPVR